MSTVIPESSRTLRLRGSIVASMIFGGGFIGGIDQGEILAHKAKNVMQFLVGETGVPRQLHAWGDPDFAFFSLAANVDMVPLGQIETEKTDPIRAVGDGDTRHEIKAGVNRGVSYLFLSVHGNAAAQENQSR
jgi:hypothetical protein